MADAGNPFASFMTPQVAPTVEAAPDPGANPFQTFVTPALPQDKPASDQMMTAMREPAIAGSGILKGLAGLAAPFAGAALDPSGTGMGVTQDAAALAPQMPGAFMDAVKSTGAIDNPALQPQGAGERMLSSAAEGVGATLPLAAAGGLPGLAWGALTGATGGATGELAANAVPDHPDAARAIGNLAGGLGIFGALKGLGYISRPAIEAIERQFVPGAVDRQAADRATQAIGSDMAAGAPGPDEISAALADAGGKPLTVADAAGENTQALLGRLYRTPGPARQEIKATIENRDAGAGERITGDTNTALTGGAWTNPADIIAGQKAAAAPAYAKAYANDAYSPRLQTFLDDPVMKQGLGVGVKMERLESVAEGRPFDQALSQGLGLDADGNWVTVGTPNMRVLDAGKRGLDAMVEAARNPLTQKLSPMGRSTAIFRDAYVKELDNLNSDYAAARAAFSGPAQSQAAIAAGANSLNLAPSEAATQLARLSPADQALFRQGAQDAYAKQIGNTSLGGNEALSVMGNATKQQRLLALAKDNDSYNAAMKGLAAEKKMFDLKNATLGGSQTAARAAEDGAGQGGHGGGSILALAGNSLLHGEPSTAAGLVAMRYLGQILNRNRTSMSPAVNAATAKLLLSQDPASIGLLGRLSQSPSRLPAVATVPAGLLGSLSRPAQ